MIKNFLFIDLETYYDKDYSLRNMTVPEYIWHPKYKTIMLAAFDIRWPAPKIILPEDIRDFLADYPPEETMCCSHNFLFDGPVLAWRYGWVAERMQDTLGMVRALRRYKRNSLGAVAKELFGYDSKGDTIHKVMGLDTQGIKNAGLWPDFCTYAMNDVRLCSQIYFKLYPEFPVEEQLVMDLVLRAAVQPVLHANAPMLQQHLDALRAKKEALLRDCGFDKAQLMSTIQFREALEGLGVNVKTKMSAAGNEVPQFAKSDPFMGELLEYDQDEEDINVTVQTLAAARLQHKSTIEETRAQKFINVARLPWPDGPMMPIPLRYGGAHTHRLSGDWGMNLQNLPRDGSKSKLRQSIMAPPGHKIVAADLAQIEARVVASFCGQDDLVEQFRRGDDVYSNFASLVFRKPINKTTNPNERFIGKTAVLGLGYGCGATRFNVMVTTMARQAGIPLEGLFDAEVAQKTVDTYRDTFPRITRMWRRLDRVKTMFLENRLESQAFVEGPVKIMLGRILLPNGLYLQYEIPDQHLYGAKMLENIVQALARIVVMQAAVRLARQGYRFAMQAHDELVFVVPDDEVARARQTILEEMTVPPEWMPTIPLAAEAGVGNNYAEAK